jgi:hypothetical protein
MNTSTTDPNSLKDCLEDCGWQQESFRRWTHPADGKQAILEQLEDCGDWRQYRLEGGAVPDSSRGRMFHDNHRLYGPVKFVAPPKRAPFCRVDLPKEFSPDYRSRHAELPGPDFEALRAQDPRQAWSAAVTACVTGETAGLCEPPPVDTELVERLNDFGWPASNDDGQLQVHLHLPGLFRHVRIERQAGGGWPGTKIVADLLSLDGVSGLWRRAALHLAQAANRRLPLVRVALKTEAGLSVLRAEVHIGCAPVSGQWLPTALEVVETAVSLTARELQALRDRELAKLVLAADAA